MRIWIGIWIGILMEVLIEILMEILIGIFMGILWEFFMGILMMDLMGWPYDSFYCLSSPKRVDFYLTGEGITAHTLPVIFYIFPRYLELCKSQVKNQESKS